MYRTWFAIGLAGLLGGVAVVSLFAGFGSPVFLGVAAVSAAGGFLAYRYARERMLASVYAGVETDPAGTATDGSSPDDLPPGGAHDRDDGTVPGDAGATSGVSTHDDRERGRDRTTQATDGGSTTADYDDWTWTDSDPDDPFWSDDPEDWEDPWEWEATDPAEAAEGGWRRGPGDGSGGDRWSGWSGGERRDGTADDRGGGRRRGRSDFEHGEGERPTVTEAYATLGLEPGADLDAVRRAYRERAKETHPDRGGDPGAFIRVREAYERLRERLEDEA